MRQTIEATVLTTPEATVVEVEGSAHLETYRGNLKATGYAKKHPNDEHDAEVGHALAMARALRDLADRYEKRAWERINHPPQTVTYAIGGVMPENILRPYSMEVSGGGFDHAWLDRALGSNREKTPGNV